MGKDTPKPDTCDFEFVSFSGVQGVPVSHKYIFFLGKPPQR